jgi:[amino group carrier protein]-lysine/ornithine hydrolase
VDEACELLKKMVGIDSVSGSEKELAEFMNRYLKKKGFESEIDSVGNVVASLGEKNGCAEILFCGHLDTVPGKIPVRVEKKILHGRGSVDAKGAMAAFVSGAIKAAPKLRNTHITLALTVEEELFSKGTKYVAGKFKPEFIIIGEPSNTNGITLGYKGSVRIKYFLKESMFHRSFPQKGVIEKTIDFWNQINKFCEEFNKNKNAFERVDFFVHSINSSTNGIEETVEAEIGFRVPMGFEKEKFGKLFQKKPEKSELKFLEFLQAYRSNKSNVLVNSFASAIRSIGEKPVFKVKTGTADFNILGPFHKVPIIAYGPGDSLLDHTPKECIDLNDYKKSIEVIEQVLRIIDSKNKG